ncbi:hypothetical protein NKJ72_22360 [Mesorhizobium sp. M0045]
MRQIVEIERAERPFDLDPIAGLQIVMQPIRNEPARRSFHGNLQVERSRRR